MGVAGGRTLRRLLAASALLVAGAAARAQSAFPEPPTGFHWERAKEIRAAFLIPNKWFFKAEKDKDTLAYFVSREDIDKAGAFRVGLTVNVMPHLPGRDAAEVARGALAQMIDGKTRHDCGDVDMKQFVGGGCLVEDATTTMRCLTLANPKTNTLYVFIFEAPTGEWAEADPVGREILGRMMLDDDV